MKTCGIRKCTFFAIILANIADYGTALLVIMFYMKNITNKVYYIKQLDHNSSLLLNKKKASVMRISKDKKSPTGRALLIWLCFKKPRYLVNIPTSGFDFIRPSLL